MITLHDVSPLPRYPAPMKNSALIQGTYAEIEARLEADGKEAAGRGRKEKAAAVARGLNALKEGYTMFRVRHAVYRVVRDEEDYV